MELLKDEKLRYRERARACRGTQSIHPEQLCDDDILYWRLPEGGYIKRRTGEVVDAGTTNVIQDVRYNDTPDISSFTDPLMVVHHQFRACL